jgi:adenylate cyclase
LRWPTLARHAWTRIPGLREAGLAIFVALAVLVGLNQLGSPLLRGLETASLDLRFRLRGVKPAEPDTVVVLVDDKSLAALGRWPFSRRLFAKAVDLLDRAGAKVIAFDLLFAEPEEKVPPEMRAAARAAVEGLSDTSDPRVRQALARLAGDDPDGDLAAALRRSGKVLLPFAFSRFSGEAEEAPLLAE